ncbi:hydrocephalus-inducing protein homolog [Vidua macroura]|uniref:hydrocephalus-inducing protein homolog n=1 Tax=Vidua macroura TaxID=187451 RepID=UPI0023A81011|nr:hydrocephalus-inducing protein homolog [Vidua macroura]
MFHNCTHGEVCEVPLALRNRDKVSLLVKVTLESSPYFQLVGPNDMCCKVPLGPSMTFRVLFTPGQNKDYFHQLLCTTEKEEFIVPICVIPDFPGQLDFSACRVKCSTQKTLLAGNQGSSLPAEHPEKKPFKMEN